MSITVQDFYSTIVKAGTPPTDLFPQGSDTTSTTEDNRINQRGDGPRIIVFVDNFLSSPPGTSYFTVNGDVVTATSLNVKSYREFEYFSPEKWDTAVSWTFTFCSHKQVTTITAPDSPVGVFTTYDYTTSSNFSYNTVKQHPGIFSITTNLSNKTIAQSNSDIIVAWTSSARAEGYRVDIDTFGGKWYFAAYPHIVSELGLVLSCDIKPFFEGAVTDYSNRNDYDEKTTIIVMDVLDIYSHLDSYGTELKEADVLVVSYYVIQLRWLDPHNGQTGVNVESKRIAFQDGDFYDYYSLPYQVYFGRATGALTAITTDFLFRQADISSVGANLLFNTKIKMPEGNAYVQGNGNIYNYSPTIGQVLTQQNTGVKITIEKIIDRYLYGHRDNSSEFNLTDKLTIIDGGTQVLFIPVESTIPNLLPQTVYRYRVDVACDIGLNTGNVVSFTTGDEFVEQGYDVTNSNILTIDKNGLTVYKGSLYVADRIDSVYTAKIFHITTAINIKGVVFYFSKERGNKDNMVFTIRGVDSGKPNDTILYGPVTINIESVIVNGKEDFYSGVDNEGYFSKYLIAIPSGLSLDADTDYSFVIKPSALPNKDIPIIEWGASSTPALLWGGKSPAGTGNVWNRTKDISGTVVFNSPDYDIYYELVILAKPTTPTPANISPPSPLGTIDVVNIGGSILNSEIKWKQGGGATSYDIYYNFGGSVGSAPYFVTNVVATDASSPTEGTQETYSILWPLASLTPFIGFSSLRHDVLYSWRIDAKDNFGNIATGDVWHFRTAPMRYPIPTPSIALWPTPIPPYEDPTISAGDNLVLGLNNMTTYRRLVAAAANTLFIENI